MNSVYSDPATVPVGGTAGTGGLFGNNTFGNFANTNTVLPVTRLNSISTPYTLAAGTIITPAGTLTVAANDVGVPERWHAAPIHLPVRRRRPTSLLRACSTTRRTARQPRLPDRRRRDLRELRRTRRRENSKSDQLGHRPHHRPAARDLHRDAEQRHEPGHGQQHGRHRHDCRLDPRPHHRRLQRRGMERRRNQLLRAAAAVCHPRQPPVELWRPPPTSAASLRSAALAITGNPIIVKYTYDGDGSLDGKVDLGNDFSSFSSWPATSTARRCSIPRT